MINLTRTLVFCLKGTKLLNLANACIALIPQLMHGVILSKDMRRRYETFERLFCQGQTFDKVSDTEATLQYWYSIIMERRGKRQLTVSSLLPGADCPNTIISYEDFKPFVKLFLF